VDDKQLNFMGINPSVMSGGEAQQVFPALGMPLDVGDREQTVGGTARTEGVQAVGVSAGFSKERGHDRWNRMAIMIPCCPLSYVKSH